MDQTERSAWYDQTLPHAGESAQTQPSGNAKPQKPRRNRKALRITLIIIGILIVLGAAVYSAITTFSFRFHANVNGKEYSVGTPPAETPSLPAGSEPGADYSEDYKEFFSKFFISSESGLKPSSIPRGQTGNFTLTSESAAGRQSLTLQELYSDCIDCVVGIRATAPALGGYCWGTGIVLSEDGYILTNQHIISGTTAAEVVLPDGTSYSAVLIGEDETTDLAVLQIHAKGLHPAVFGSSDELTVGDEVAAIGNPLTDNLSGTLTNGIVSAIDRNIYSYTSGKTMTLIQTTAALNEGNSGGPLFNMYGQVIGVTNMKMVNGLSRVQVEGIGFAIPSTTAKQVVDQLITKGYCSRPGLGITVGAIPADAAAHYDLPEGLYITKVSENSSAYAQGVRPGDVLIQADGADVRETNDVLTIRDSHAVGDEMRLTVYREGKTLEFVITLDEYSTLY